MRWLWHDTTSEPWFRRAPTISVIVALLLYAAIFALRLAESEAVDATLLFLVLPIALLAITFGLVAGLIGAVVAIGMMASWAIAEHITLSPVGWATRVVPLLLLGALLGHATDRLRAAEKARVALEQSAHWHGQAVEINDSIVQGLVAAKWSLESGKTDAAEVIVAETLDHAQTMVSQLLRESGRGLAATRAPGS